MNLNDKSLMIIDDDDIFRNRLITAMKRKGYEAYGASSVSEAKSLVNSNAPKYAVIDLRLNDGNGLEVVSVLSNKRPDSKIVMLTGYGKIYPQQLRLLKKVRAIISLNRRTLMILKPH